jgi:hypothetical protein
MKIHLLFVLATLFLFSCTGKNFKTQRIEDYKNGIIIEKSDDKRWYPWVKVKTDSNITGAIFIHEYDWDRCKVGDTIQ